MVDIEAQLTFIYKTISIYSKFEDYLKKKLEGTNPKENKIYEGYLIDKKYFDYWVKYSDYNLLRQIVNSKEFGEVKKVLYKYRKSNKYQNYQEDAVQYFFRTADEFYESVKIQNRAYVLIDFNVWKLICRESGLKEIGGMRYSIKNSTLTFYFGEFDYCKVTTKDPIIDATKEIALTDSDIVRDEDLEEEEVKKLFLLYSYEIEMKNKLNNLSYKETEFHNCYLICNDWISYYKKLYHYDEMVKMIEKNEKLKRMLSNGFKESQKNIPYIMKNIVIKEKKDLPPILKDNNTFLVERNDETFTKKESVSYWKNFILINEELKCLFSYSKAHEYSFNDSSYASVLIACGKIIINLSQDEYNPKNYAVEIGSLNNADMTFNEEYILNYDDVDSLNEDLCLLLNDYFKYQKEYLIFGKDLECDLISKEGRVYGTGKKILNI